MKDGATGEENQTAMCNDSKKPNDKRIIAVFRMHHPLGNAKAFELY